MVFVLNLTSYSQTKSGKIIYKKTNNIAQSMKKFEASKTTVPDYYFNVLKLTTENSDLLKNKSFELLYCT